MSTGCDPCSLAVMPQVKPRELGELTGETSTIMHWHSKNSPPGKQRQSLTGPLLVTRHSAYTLHRNKVKVSANPFFLFRLNRNRSQCSVQMHQIHCAAMYSRQVEPFLPHKTLSIMNQQLVNVHVFTSKLFQPEGMFHIFMRYIL